MDFIKGICHPGTDYSLIRGAGLGWARFDTAYPFDENGEPTDGYRAYRARCEALAANGISSIGITPYPAAFLAHGIDPRTEEGLARCADVCRFLASDLAGLVRCWQITNEMYVIQFRAPLVAEQTFPFIAACGRGLREGNPDALIGHNSACEANREADKRLADEIGLGFAGLDCYAGSWGDGGPKDFHGEIERLHSLTGLPVILQEFGFASTGGQLMPGDELKYLNAHGFADWAEAEAELDRLLGVIPAPLAARALDAAPEERFVFVRSSMNHILKKWSSKGDIEHTREGQARFYSELLPSLLSEPNLMGAVIYCWQDSSRCFLCGEPDCPCETAWGLTDVGGLPKPAYAAVKKVFA